MMWKWLTRWAADTWGSRPMVRCDTENQPSGATGAQRAILPVRRGRRSDEPAVPSLPQRPPALRFTSRRIEPSARFAVFGQGRVPEYAEPAVGLQQRELHVLQVAVGFAQRLEEVVLRHVLRRQAVGQDSAISPDDHRLALNEPPKGFMTNTETIRQRIDGE